MHFQHMAFYYWILHKNLKKSSFRSRCFYVLVRLYEKYILDKLERQKLLLQKYLENRCTPEEAAQVLAWMGKDEYNEEQRDAILHLLRSNPEMNGEVLKNLDERLRLNFEDISRRIGENKPAKKRYLFFYMQAAAILLLVTGVVFFTLYNRPVSSTASNKKYSGHSIVPGGNKAILTLADGSTVTLEDAKDGSLVQQGGATVVKAGDKLVYNKNAAGPVQAVFNTVSTPRGGQYRITLPDGTNVWLNAATSLTYPTIFTGKERIVELKGEAYFEVAASFSATKQKIPFIVKAEDNEVTVLGTHFNVNAYKDEEAIKTTLIEGSVKVSNGSSEILIKPGEQARQKNGTKLLELHHPDLEEVLAWKDGKFLFNNADAKSIVRQISRWYDVDIEYKSDLSGIYFSGGLSKKDQIEELIELLELSGRMKFEINGRKLLVMTSKK